MRVLNTLKALIFTLLLCVNGCHSCRSKLARLMKFDPGEHWRMAGILNEDPYFAKDPRTGEWRGFAVEMARDIAENIGVKLEVVESSWANSILDVQSGKVDLALALTALPKRALSVHFTSPTYYNSFVIISPKASMKDQDLGPAQ